MERKQTSFSVKSSECFENNSKPNTMSEAIHQALQHVGCNVEQVAHLLNQLNIFEQSTDVQLYCISKAAAETRAASTADLTFIQELQHQIQQIIATDQKERLQKHHQTTAVSSHLSFKVPPSTLGFFFKYDKCERYLHTSCSTSSKTTGRLQLPDALRSVTLKGLLLTKGFQWEDDLEDLLENPVSSTCLYMRNSRNNWWEKNPKPNKPDNTTSSIRQAYQVLSLDKENAHRTGNKLDNPKQQMKESMRCLQTSVPGTALVQTRFRVPESMLNEIQLNSNGKYSKRCCSSCNYR